MLDDASQESDVMQMSDQAQTAIRIQVTFEVFATKCRQRTHGANRLGDRVQDLVSHARIIEVRLALIVNEGIGAWRRRTERRIECNGEHIRFE